MTPPLRETALQARCAFGEPFPAEHQSLKTAPVDADVTIFA